MVRPLNQLCRASAKVPRRHTCGRHTKSTIPEQRRLTRMSFSTAVDEASTKQHERVALPAGIVSSSVTPFAADGSLQLDRLKPHIDWLIAEGSNGLSPLGSSGEFPALEVAD